MEATCHEDKKFQSNGKLFSSPTTDPAKRDILVNPYNRSVFGSRMRLKWSQPDNANHDDDDGVVSGLPEFECGVLANSYTDVCPYCLRETSDQDHADDQETRPRDCCREYRARQAAYWKIKELVENAVKVISFSQPRD